MKLRSKYLLSILVLVITLIVSSCSAPAYQRNKYRSGKRFRDCGCSFKPADNTSMLSLNEQK